MSQHSGANGPEAQPLLPMLLVGNGIIGGMEQYVLSLLGEFRRRGQRSLVSAPFLGEFTTALLEQGHPPEDFYIFDMGGQINFRALAHLITVLRARGVDLVHSQLLPADILGGAAAAHLDIPAISTLHGTVHSIDEVLLHDLYGVEYITVSRAGEASAIANGLPARAVRCIPNGVDTHRFDPARCDRAALRRELGIAPEQLLVTSVSRLAREKNPWGLLRAAELAGAEDERLVFLLVGTGPEEPELRRAQAASPLGERFRLVGARHDIPELLAASDVFALASGRESSPFAVLEAMAMRLPVVCYDVGGLGELVASGTHGFLLPFEDAEHFAARIRELAADPALRERIGAAARHKVLEHYELAAAAEGVLQFYRDIVGERTLRAARPVPRLDPSPPFVETRSPGSFSRPEESGAAPDPLAGLGVPVVDSHLHLSGSETTDGVVATLDRAGVEAACLIGPFLAPGTWIPMRGAALGRANGFLLELIARAPERCWGLVTVDPRSRSAPRELEELSRAPGVRGVKLIPHGWSPADSCALRVYEACEALGLPILFHSGIFISGRPSDDCRPARYEAVRRFPRLRVVLAHLGWPWVDEAIAVALMDPLRGDPQQIYLDTSPGTPPIYREDAMRKALTVLGPAPILWGSDRFLPAPPEAIQGPLHDDLALLRRLGADGEALRRILGGNAAELFRPRAEPVAVSGDTERGVLQGAALR